MGEPQLERTPFAAPTATDELEGRLTGDGPPVLALHGGPGLGFEYLDDAVDEVAARYRVATFQQRGLSPSVIETGAGHFVWIESPVAVLAAMDRLVAGSAEA